MEEKDTDYAALFNPQDTAKWRGYEPEDFLILISLELLQISNSINQWVKIVHESDEADITLEKLEKAGLFPYKVKGIMEIVLKNNGYIEMLSNLVYQYAKDRQDAK